MPKATYKPTKDLSRRQIRRLVSSNISPRKSLSSPTAVGLTERQRSALPLFGQLGSAGPNNDVHLGTVNESFVALPLRKSGLNCRASDLKTASSDECVSASCPERTSSNSDVVASSLEKTSTASDVAALSFEKTLSVSGVALSSRKTSSNRNLAASIKKTSPNIDVAALSVDLSAVADRHSVPTEPLSCDPGKASTRPLNTTVSSLSPAVAEIPCNPDARCLPHESAEERSSLIEPPSGQLSSSCAVDLSPFAIAIQRNSSGAETTAGVFLPLRYVNVPSSVKDTCNSSNIDSIISDCDINIGSANSVQVGRDVADFNIVDYVSECEELSNEPSSQSMGNYDSDATPDNTDCSDDEVSDVGICSGDESKNEKFNFDCQARKRANEEPMDVPTGKPKFQDLLSDWAVKFKITLTALTALLAILSLIVPNLPKDARTLMKTPRKTKIRDVKPGSYWHRGIGKGIKEALMYDDREGVKVDINIDGLPLAKSSGSSLWPILGKVDKKVFLIGAYHGYSKPDDPSDYLKDFIAEGNEILDQGLEVNGKNISVEFDKWIFDAPAKTYTLNLNGHGAYCSCTKCQVYGEYDKGRVYFPELNALLRTDEQFIDPRSANSNRKPGPCALLALKMFRPVSSVCLDYMHLICLGTMRKIFNLLIHGPLTVRLPSAIVKEISDCLCSLQTRVPKEFVRKPRSLMFLKQWKATEFRQFLLYSGPVVLLKILKQFPNVYSNFLTLHVACFILCSPELCKNVDTVLYASSLLRVFVGDFASIYGVHYVSHNVHNLIHLGQEVLKFGCLDNFSAFPFENFLQRLKSKLRKSEKPLQQIARRYEEEEGVFKNPSKFRGEFTSPTFHDAHFSGPLPAGYCCPQYSKLKIHGFTLDLSKANNCCGLDDGTIVVIENFAYSRARQCVMVLGRSCLSKSDFYSHPCPSSVIGIFKVAGLSSMKAWPVERIVKKYYRMPVKTDHVVVPLLHIEV